MCCCYSHHLPHSANDFVQARVFVSVNDNGAHNSYISAYTSSVLSVFLELMISAQLSFYITFTIYWNGSVLGIVSSFYSSFYFCMELFISRHGLLHNDRQWSWGKGKNKVIREKRKQKLLKTETSETVQSSSCLSWWAKLWQPLWKQASVSRGWFLAGTEPTLSHISPDTCCILQNVAFETQPWALQHASELLLDSKRV